MKKKKNVTKTKHSFFLTFCEILIFGFHGNRCQEKGMPWKPKIKISRRFAENCLRKKCKLTLFEVVFEISFLFRMSTLVLISIVCHDFYLKLY